MLRRLTPLLLIALVLLTVHAPGAAAADTRVIVLGTGYPQPDYTRAGAGIAVIHDGEAYLFDAGRGTIQRAIEAFQRLGIRELDPVRIDHLFVTHLHSDHLHDYLELAASRWWEREQALKAWGPAGFAEMTQHGVAMLAVEARTRKAGTPSEAIPNPDGYRVRAHDIEPGLVFDDNGIRVTAFTVPHGDIRPSLGYRIETPGKVIVISGDTGFSEEIIRQSRDADLLFHEVISAEALKNLPEYWQHYHGTSHTPADELARLASRARPGKLVLYHSIFLGRTADELLGEVRDGYDGDVVLANDLDIF